MNNKTVIVIDCRSGRTPYEFVQWESGLNTQNGLWEDRQVALARDLATGEFHEIPVGVALFADLDEPA